MQRVIAEAVQLVQLALIHTLLPVDIEHAFRDDRHLVHLVGVESNDAQTYQVGYIIDALILCTFTFQFPSQRLFGFHSVFKGRHIDALLTERTTQLVVRLLCHFLKCGHQFTVLLHQRLTMGIENYFFHNYKSCRKDTKIPRTHKEFAGKYVLFVNIIVFRVTKQQKKREIGEIEETLMLKRRFFC